MKSIIKAMLVVAGMVSAAHSFAQSYNKHDIAAEAGKIKIDSVLDLPITGMRAIESSEGVIFISKDGRFAFKGKMYDIWNQAQYSTISEIKDGAYRVSLEKMQIKTDQLNTFVIGKGPTEITVFIDPNCPYCHKAVNLALAEQEKYTFKFIMVAMLGDESSRAVLQASCARNKVEVIPAMLSNSINSLELVAQQDCRREPVEKSAMVAQLLGIEAVPYTITSKGAVVKGFPSNYADIIKSN